MSALTSNAEEINTRIVLCAVYAANSETTSRVVCGPDTDTLVLLVHHQSAINCANIHFMTGKKEKLFDNTIFIPVHLIKLCLASSSYSIPAMCMETSYRSHECLSIHVHWNMTLKLT